MATKTSRTALLWLIPIIGLVGWLGHVTNWGNKFGDTDVEWRRVRSPQVATGVVVPDIAFNADASPYAVITDRNLFAPWRKPSPPPEPAKVAAEPPKPQIRRGVYTLIGTMQIGDNVIATVKEAGTGRSKQVRAGDTLQEYAVQKVESERVLLAFAGQTEELVLPRFTQSGRSPIPTPVAAAQNAPMSAAPISSQPMGVAQGAVQVDATRAVQQTMPSTTVPAFPPPIGTPGGSPSNASQPQPTAAVPIAQQPNPEVIDVGELLRRRREARKQQ